jgi:carbamoyl-phosphate synthase large subunit
MKPAVVLLSGGSLVGENVIDALGERRAELRLLATNTEAWAPSLTRVDRVCLVPPTAADPQALKALLMQLVDEERPALVIPCRDDDVQWLARWAGELAERGVQSLVGSTTAVAHIVDKWRSAQFSLAHGLPFARSAPATDAVAVEALLGDVGWPLIVKPRAGFASLGVRILRQPRQLQAVLGDPTLLVQEYLGSREVLTRYLDELERLGVPLFNSFEELKYSLQAFIGPAGDIVGHVVTRHAMKQGKSAVVEVWEDAELDALVQRAATTFAEAGWRGPLNVQCQQCPDGRFVVYEYNGRFTGATSARALLGYDEVGLALERIAGLPLHRHGKDRVAGEAVLRTPRSWLRPPTSVGQPKPPQPT